MNERKIKILQAIINDYIATAEPVGSRTIAKKYDLGISSATIRNEMSDLEEMGLIVQPHASAGRIPSDLGYRLYVDRIMQQKELMEDQERFLESVVARNINQIDYLMDETARALSKLTNYTTIISEPALKKTKLKQIRLVPLDSRSVMLVIATEENFIRNQIISVPQAPDDDTLNIISARINSCLKGHTLEDIDDNTVLLLQQELGENRSMLQPILMAVEKTIHSAEKSQIHMSGTKNILGFPEFSDVEKAKDLFQTLEEKNVLVSLLGEAPQEGLQILIGNENTIQEMKGCSVIRTSYSLGDNTTGQIGIIGPTRMNYSQVVSVLNGMVRNIEKVLRALGKDHQDP